MRLFVCLSACLPLSACLSDYSPGVMFRCVTVFQQTVTWWMLFLCPPHWSAEGMSATLTTLTAHTHARTRMHAHTQTRTQRDLSIFFRMIIDHKQKKKCPFRGRMRSQQNLKQQLEECHVQSVSSEWDHQTCSCEHLLLKSESDVLTWLPDQLIWRVPVWRSDHQLTVCKQSDGWMEARRKHGGN